MQVLQCTLEPGTATTLQSMDTPQKLLSLFYRSVYNKQCKTTSAHNNTVASVGVLTRPDVLHCFLLCTLTYKMDYVIFSDFEATL